MVDNYQNLVLFIIIALLSLYLFFINLVFFNEYNVIILINPEKICSK